MYILHFWSQRTAHCNNDTCVLISEPVPAVLLPHEQQQGDIILPGKVPLPVTFFFALSLSLKRFPQFFLIEGLSIYSSPSDIDEFLEEETKVLPRSSFDPTSVAAAFQGKHLNDGPLRKMEKRWKTKWDAQGPTIKYSEGESQWRADSPKYSSSSSKVENKDRVKSKSPRKDKHSSKSKSHKKSSKEKTRERDDDEGFSEEEMSSSSTYKRIVSIQGSTPSNDRKSHRDKKKDSKLKEDDDLSGRSRSREKKRHREDGSRHKEKSSRSKRHGSTSPSRDSRHPYRSRSRSPKHHKSSRYIYMYLLVSFSYQTI